MSYIQINTREQSELFPISFDEMIDEESPVRFFDRFVNNLNLSSMGFSKSIPAKEGRPAYDPKDLLKLYLYGYFYGIRSSRKLARECCVNIEVMWLINQLKPNFRTISDFRKENSEVIPKVFNEFNKYCVRMNILSQSCISIDGSKFLAVNSRDKNFTQSRLDVKIEHLNRHITKYMDELAAGDVKEDRLAEIESNLKSCRQRLETYQSYQNRMIAEGKTQLSLTDPDSKLMKMRDGFGVAYNTQTAVDASSHLIAGYKVTNSTIDYGFLTEIATEVKKNLDSVKTQTSAVEVIADKGYQDKKDMASALENGIIPNVIQKKGVTEVTVTFDYEESEISEDEKKSTESETLKKCLHAGTVPEIYKDILSFCGIKKESVKSESENADVVSMTKEEMLEKARSGYFVRNPESNIVYCPQGKILRAGCTDNKNGAIRYWNRIACADCSIKCTKAKYKEIHFYKDEILKKASDNIRGNNGKMKKNFLKKEVAEFKLKINLELLARRQCLSEHPFGTVKRSLNGYYLLLRGKKKASAEMSLIFLAYNLRRAINISGIRKMMDAI